MFMDLADPSRSILKHLGYDQPQVIVVLLAPIPDPNSPKKALVNTVAGLMELNHFSTREVNFTARFDDREGTIIDPEAPLTRTIILSPSLDAEEERAAQEVATLAGDLLFRDLTTPLGKVADQGRAKVASPQQPASTIHCPPLSLFALYQ